MMIERATIPAAVQPNLIPRAGGGWLATSPPYAPFAIGVTALTEGEAIEKFRITYSRWLELYRGKDIAST